MAEGDSPKLNDGWSTYPHLRASASEIRAFKKAIISGRGYIWR